MKRAALLIFVGCSVFFSCDLISSDSETDRLKEQVIFTSNRSASNTPGELDELEGATIHRMNPDGSGVTEITNQRAENESHFEVSVSPNGEKIVFSLRIIHQDSLDEFYIYTADYDGANMTEIAGTDEDHIINPRWSPVDSKIVFASNRYGNYDIYTVNSDGTELTQITISDSTDAFPAWSPNGDEIAFTSNRDGDSDIYVKNLETDQVRQITNDEGNNNFPRWSPDGNRIAFTSDRDGDDEAYITDLDGTNITQLTHSETSDSPFSWSPDGNEIVIFTYRDGNLEVFKIDVDGSQNPVNLSNNPATDWDPEWNYIKVPEN